MSQELRRTTKVEYNKQVNRIEFNKKKVFQGNGFGWYGEKERGNMEWKP